MPTVFLEYEGVVNTEFMAKGKKITDDSYCKILQNLEKEIKEHGRGKLRDGIIMLHDNAKPHAAQMLLNIFALEVWPHPP